MTDTGIDLIQDHVFYPHIRRLRSESFGEEEDICFTCGAPEARHYRVAVRSTVAMWLSGMPKQQFRVAF